MLSIKAGGETNLGSVGAVTETYKSTLTTNVTGAVVETYSSSQTTNVSSNVAITGSRIDLN